MDSKEIIEGNKLIAEFMGCYGDAHFAGGEQVYRYGFKDTHITERWHESEFLDKTPYHSSWDWLMPVVKKIKDLAMDRDLEFNEALVHKEAKSRFTPIANECGNVNIENVHYCVIKFVTWLNSQQNKTQQ